MPRPGPRPYECVRRAWHSDRHQPMRGSLIQEIFRLANEVHSSGTRKNKEWQEKLPFVVLKAEEIMYSKANSEAEYMDLNTLWDRANDAIDTIIRKDDANESGDLLQPCIEAALNLGCIPRRASRSQRHNNPVSYLSPKEATVVSQKSQDSNNKIHHQVSSTSMLPPLLPIQSSPLQCSPNQFASKPVVPEIQFMASSASKEKNSSLEATKEEFSCIVRGFPMPKESCIWPGLGRVYPLYYGEGHYAPNSQLQSHTIAREQTINTIFSPVIAVRTASKPPPLIECDLSLRLGLPCPPTFENESSCVYETEDAGSSSSYDGSKSCGPLPGGAGTVNLESSLSSAKDKGFDFFSVDNYESYLTNGCDRNQMGYASGALTDHCFRWKL